MWMGHRRMVAWMAMHSPVQAACLLTYRHTKDEQIFLSGLFLEST